MVVREVRLIEKCDANFMVWNIPESTEEAMEDRKKHDENRIKDVLKEIKMEEVVMENVVRSGLKGGRFPRKIKVIFMMKEACNKVLEIGESTNLANNVRITQDRTFNQRQEARLFRLEKEKEEEGEGVIPVATTQGGGGRGQGRGRGKGAGRPKESGRGRGGAGRPEYRKRQYSERESGQSEAEDEENKKRPVLTPATQTSPVCTSTSSSIAAAAAAEAAKTPPRPPLLSLTERPSTPHPIPTPRMVAVDAKDQQSF